MILFCGNGKQQPVTTSTSLNMPSHTQANIIVPFERADEASKNIDHLGCITNVAMC
ncbi:hypothetical protein EC55989_1372 [Escherichia coli 55989]|uniref:Uncharacterized protein n=2 Tax=Escherichia coli TaxID=562 RepID=B7LHM1_ECO55|nr:hypothetical protein EC55989_1372 [Escherichia coli 55989]